ncbi:BatD family protein, partial [Geminisphaera colitermitum]|uniref:BatD family protein n=1 Tax=Geminisphaera colitermitum TaxID=1148786 RepID=UPI0018E3446F
MNTPLRNHPVIPPRRPRHIPRWMLDVGRWMFDVRGGALLATFAFTATLAAAQTIRWEPSTGSLARDQETRLALVFENCKPKGEITLPTVDGLTFGTPGISNQSININFNSYSSVILSYPVRAAQRPQIRIPSFIIETDRGKIAVPPAEYTVVEATVDQSGTPLDDVANSHFSLPKEPVWVGQVFPLTYRLNLALRHGPRLNGQLEWNPSPLVVEDWPAKPTETQYMRGSQKYATLAYTTRALATQTGAIQLNNAAYPIALVTGRNILDAVYTAFTISTPPAALTIKPLPQPAPATFNGAVGDFTLTSKIVPENCTVGDPITWTLELTGTGNWPSITALPPRDVSRDFRVVQPRAQKTQKDNTLFDATLSEDVILIPTKPGSYTLGPVELTVFDPVAGQYKTLTAPAVTIHATAAQSANIQHPTSNAQHPMDGQAASNATQPSPLGRSTLDVGRSTFGGE